MRLKHVFDGVPAGTVCTGTVHLFRLPVPDLLDRKIISVQRMETEGAATQDHYVFDGFPDETMSDSELASD